jgi:hypothetical protein
MASGRIYVKGAEMTTSELDYIADRVAERMALQRPVCSVFAPEEIEGVKRGLRTLARIENTALATVVGFVVIGLCTAVIAGLAARFGWRMGGTQ